MLYRQDILDAFFQFYNEMNLDADRHAQEGIAAAILTLAWVLTRKEENE